MKNTEKPALNICLGIAATVMSSAPLAFQPGLAEVVTAKPAFSPDIQVFIASTLLEDENVAVDQGGSVSLAALGALPVSTDLDAVHMLPGGDILFSLDTAVPLGGTLYRACDVIRYNGLSWSKEFDCWDKGLPAGVNVDAVAMTSANLLISLDVDAQIGGQFYSDSDIIAVDGRGFSKFMDAASAGINASADVDALEVDDQGRVLLSFDTAGTLGGINYADEDVLAWNGANWSLEFDGSVRDAAFVSADVDAWSFLIAGELLFRDGFED